MFRILFLLFIIVPIIEITVLIQVGNLIGLWPTVMIVILTAWLGAKNVRQQGLATLASVQQKMARGEAPSDEIVAGLLLIVAGVLLVTPGFVTDILGLLLLVPQCRQAIIRSVQMAIIHQQQKNPHFHFHQRSHYTVYGEQQLNEEQTRKNSTIDGEFERKD